jgi:hypothetical protein
MAAGERSHPRRFVISAGEGFQSVWSPAQIRPATSAAWQRANAAAYAAAQEPPTRKRAR